MMDNTIGFVGAGNMGGAIIRGLLSGGACKASDILVSDPRSEVLDDLERLHPGLRTDTGNTRTAGASVVILAVKPQVYPVVIAGIRDTLSESAVLVTIAAGITIDAVKGWLNRPIRVVRTMPNTPALVAMGITAICPEPGTDEEAVVLVEKIFRAVGRTVRVPESQIDAFTALAGSGPALVFMFLEALADGAVREGIPRDMAYSIAARMIAGSAALADETGEHPGVLKDRVCSPSGTTIEAVAVLERAGFRSAVIEAISECTSRARELGQR